MVRAIAQGCNRGPAKVAKLGVAYINISAISIKCVTASAGWTFRTDDDVAGKIHHVRHQNDITVLVSRAGVGISESRGERDCALVSGDTLNRSPLKLGVVIPSRILTGIGQNDKIPCSPAGNWLLE